METIREEGISNAKYRKHAHISLSMKSCTAAITSQSSKKSLKLLNFNVSSSSIFHYPDSVSRSTYAHKSTENIFPNNESFPQPFSTSARIDLSDETMFGLPGKYTFAKTTVKDKPPPSLMQLPIEIRLQIYRYLLVTKNKISNPGALIKCGIRLGNDCAAWRIYPNLTMKILRISRQVYNEALPIFYQENTFSFSCAEDMVHFQFNGLRWGRLSSMCFCIWGLFTSRSN